MLDDLAELDSVEVMEKGPDILKKRIGRVKDEEHPEYYTPNELAKKTKMKPQTIRNWVKVGKIKAVKAGSRRLLIPVSEAESLLKRVG